MSSSALFFDSSVSFSSLPLDRRLFKSLARQRLVYPSLIQSKVIPIALEGKDLLVKARTGAGKTLAYCIPVVQNLLVHQSAEREQERGNKKFSPGISCVILVPSKELCDQVKKTVEPLLYYCSDSLSCLSLLPDVPKSVQIPQLQEHPSIVISTPGRLLDFLKGCTITLNNMQMLVIDEADLLFSYGYESELRELLDYFPPYKQSYLMSATLAPEIETLKSLVLHSPAIIKLEENNENNSNTTNLSQFYLLSPLKDKSLLLYTLLKLTLFHGKLLIYTNSIQQGFYIKLFLELFSIKSAVLNDHLPLNSRLHLIQQFNRGVIEILIATDEALEEEEEESIGKKEQEEESQEEEKQKEHKKPPVQVLIESDETTVEDPLADENELEEFTKKKKRNRKEFNSARGLDFQDVATVLNFDFPLTVKSYTHRIGRTARAGKLGTALSLVSPDEEELLSHVINSQAEAAAAIQLNPEPALKCLEFNLSDIEGFRYRVEDVSRAVTKVAVREAMLKDIKNELINSEKLKAHFEDNPRELNLLKHDKLLRPAKVQPHLKHVPNYLMPANLQAVANSGASINSINIGARSANNRKPKRKQFSNPKAANPAQKKKAKAAEDPLRAFAGALKQSESSTSQSTLSSSRVGFHESAAGRNRWKERHLTGKKSQKKSRAQL
jgi:ATP-dependent RNA helicase DDX56/DBP9